LWGELPESQARGNLSQALYNLRGALGDRPATGSLAGASDKRGREPYLLVKPQTIQFNPHSTYHADVSEFVELFAGCEAHDHPPGKVCEDCLDRYQAAVTLYTGDFLSDFYLGDSVSFEEWVTVTRERLRRMVIDALEHLVADHQRRGELDRALEYAHRMVAVDDLWEPGHQHVMRLLALTERRREALVHYERYRQALDTELGVEPERETAVLYQRLQGEDTTRTTLENLPANLTPFVGRRPELAELWAMLRDPACRLVTVLGPGGSGKTRLALEASRALRYDFPDGVYFVPLSALNTPESLLPAVIDVLGMTTLEDVGTSRMGHHDPEVQLHDYLRGKRLLLIFDSFETVLEGAGWVTELLRTTPGVKALVTSRARLNVKGEHRYSLVGMRYPRDEDVVDVPQYSAVELFVVEARRVNVEFDPSTPELRDVVRICRLVDGMPLGLLLAAAWVDAYTLDEIAAQITESLDFLASDWTDVPSRQRSLRATLDYSWRLLGEREREAFTRLSVFRGAFTREAAELVVKAHVPLLRILVDKCMLMVTSDDRYRMHDLVRQYAAERLTEEPVVERETRERHCAYYFDLLQAWKGDIEGARQAAALAEMDQEIGNLQAAWNWVVSQVDVECLDIGLNVLGMYYDLRGRHAEARLHYGQALALLEGLPDTQKNRLQQVDTIIKYSFSAWRHDPAENLIRLAEAERLLKELPEPDEERLARVYFWMGRAHYVLGASRQSLSYYHRVLPVVEKMGDPEMLAIITSNLAQPLLPQGQLAKAELMFRESIPLLKSQGNWTEWIRAQALHGYAIALMGEYRAGIAEELGVIERTQELNYLSEIAFSNSLYSLTHLLIGIAPNAAWQYASRSVEAAEQSGNWGYLFPGYGFVGWALVRLGQLEQAEASMAKAQVILDEKLGGQFVVADLITAARAEISLSKGDTQEALVLAEKAVDMAQAYGGILIEGIARMIWGQALANLNPPLWDEAEEQMAESVRLHESGQIRLPAAYTHVVWGKICHDRGDFEAAREHWQIAITQYEISELPDEVERSQALIDGLP
jgi:predicted ATPase/DNA-binding SARP family transcriptional activator